MQKRFHQIIEGTTKVMVPKIKNIKGPTTSKVPIFYNPVMEFNRDVSILVLRNYILDFTKDTNFKTLDGLAGTGIRGVRLANEIDGIGEVTINDRNPLAFDLIRKNIKLNKLKDTIASNNDLNVFLINNGNKFNYIDIDPFGSPVEFIEQSCRAIRDRGLIAISATDTATLCGRYPKTCVRRYGAITIKPIFRHELGIRVLIGYSARQAAKYELALTPLLVHSTDHYYRVYFQARKGSQRADKCIENIGFIWYNPENGARGFSPEPVTELPYAGPLWTGSLFDYKFTKDMVLPPDINTSVEEMAVDYNVGKIRNKLSIISGLGEKAAQKIISGRPYKDVPDCVRKNVCGPSMSKKLICWQRKHCPICWQGRNLMPPVPGFCVLSITMGLESKRILKRLSSTVRTRP